MTRRPRSRARLREALLDQEEDLRDLGAALSALSVIASAPDGIEADDMAGLSFVTRIARELAGSVHTSWRDALDHLGPRRSPTGAP